MENIATIRELEAELAKDPKKINNLISIKKYIKDPSTEYKAKVVAIHSMRRLLLSFLADGLMSPVSGADASSQKTKQAEFRNWLITQYQAFLALLCDFIYISSSNRNSESLQILSIKTIMEFVSSEWKTSVKFSPDNESSHEYFGFNCFKMMIGALLKNDKVELSVDVLLMLKDEVFKYSDCVYYGLSILDDRLQELKRHALNGSGGAKFNESDEFKYTTRNAIDLLRMIAVPEDEESLANYLVRPGNSSGNSDDKDVVSDADSDDDENDKDGSINANDTNKKAAKGINSDIANEIRKKNMTAEEQQLLMSLIGKRKIDEPAAVSEQSGAVGDKKNKKFKPTKRHEKLVHMPSYRKLFAAAWFSLLALPLSTTQHKLILQHLPLYVMDVLPKPLLLADYLTKSFECGGIVAVLALESLFQLIVKFNLDYPEFFTSLYRLCTVEVFTAKYRPTFLKLLSSSLKSINLPVYIVAAFIKRLCLLALQIPSPAALYCVTQSIWLLRKHPQAQTLIHRENGGVDAPRDVKGVLFDSFDAFEDTKLEKCNAVNSSLWELKILENHHFHSVSTLAKSLLESPESTDNGVNAAFLNLDDFIEHSYVDIMEEELKNIKKFGALAHIPPTSLFRIAPTTSIGTGSGSNLIDECFGN